MCKLGRIAAGHVYFSDSQAIPVGLNPQTGAFYDTFRSYLLGLYAVRTAAAAVHNAAAAVGDVEAVQAAPRGTQQPLLQAVHMGG